MIIKMFLKAILVAILLFVSIVMGGTPSDALLYNQTGIPLNETDFKTFIDQQSIRLTDPLLLEADSLSEANFLSKWKNSLKDKKPVEFFRSYPPAYHQDLAQISPGSIPGEEGLCLGDAHPENFGFLHLAQGSAFVYNDLDDSGYCPIAYDALRFFTALRLWFDDDVLTKDVLEQYVDVVKEPTRALTISPSLYPEWDQKAKKDLKEKTSGNQFNYSNDSSLQPIIASDRQRTDILSMATKDKHFANYIILDIASKTKDEGGSADLQRYWLLVSNKAGKRSILELKQAARPGVESGRKAQVLSMDERLPVLKKSFWNDDSDDNNFYVTVNTHRFLVRNRLNMKGIHLKDYEGNDRKKLLLVEASTMAAIHSNRWHNVKKSDLRTWLQESSKTLSRRWKSVYDQAKSAEEPQ